nr:Rrf2 family transcriptional regulator [uncultured bacterium]
MFSKTCKYAIRAMLYLAIHSDEEHKCGVEEIATELNVPKDFLAKILQQLTRHHLAASTKGRNGGFYLNEANKDASLLLVIEAIDGPETFTSCILGLPSCSNETPCTFHPQAVECRNSIVQILKKESIRDTSKRISLNNFKL